MERVNEFLSRHLWLQLLLAVLAGAVLVQLLYPQGSFAAVLVRSAVMSVGAVGVTVAIRRRERRAAGGTGGLLALERRLRTGEAPTDPGEQQAMRDLVDQRLHRTRHRKAAWVFLALMFVSITVLTGFTADTRRTVGFAVVTVVFIGWLTYSGALHHRRLRAMDAALRRTRAPRDATARS